MVETSPGGFNSQSGSAELRARTDAGARLVTLGPVGTSSYEAAGYLHGLLSAARNLPVPPVELHDTFEEVLCRAISDAKCLALVPSAYNGATSFHWHPGLSLVFHFVRQTPRYGLAVRSRPVGDGPLRVAAMTEVEQLYSELAPRKMACLPTERIAARSTRHAAELVALGAADIAVTNDSSRDEADLEWITSRPGVDIVWLVFGQATTLASVNSEESGPNLSQNLEEIG